MRILLVEDDRDLGPTLAAALRAENFAVDLATNGIDGGHLGETEAFDAAVLDLGLPGRDGIGVLQGWRAAGRNVPVLVLTAREGWPDKSGAFRAGADEFLRRPLRMAARFMRVRAPLSRCTRCLPSRLASGAPGTDTRTGTIAAEGMRIRVSASI